jgi:hypothetical protein
MLTQECCEKKKKATTNPNIFERREGGEDLFQNAAQFDWYSGEYQRV